MEKKTTEDKFAAVKRSYIASLADKHRAIATHWASISHKWNRKDFQQLYMIIHGLAGSAETFGLPDITTQARTILNQFKLLENAQTPDQQFNDFLTQDIDTLLELLQNVN